MSGYKITDKRFINPYNFVSINEPVARGEAMCGTLSGSISCELETLTPLFIPNTTIDHAFRKEYSHSYDFFSYEDLNRLSDFGARRQNYARPIIPGSSIRGMVRSAFEAATNGCMSTCDDDNILYRRTPVPRKMYGIIEKDSATGERVLYKATKGNWDINKRGNHKTGDELNGGIYLRGVDFRRGQKKGKKNDAIMQYVLDNSGKKVEVHRFKEDNLEWKNLVEVWRLYQNSQGNIKGVNQSNDHNGYPGYLNADRIPVYYAKLDNADFYYFTPAAITKEVFSRTLNTLLQQQGGHNPCQSRGYICQTCNLFGMVGKDKDAQASRLFFRDAVPIADGGRTGGWRDWYEPIRALPILSSPKVTATEFYMEDIPGTAYFNYDYSVSYYHYYDDDGRSAYAPVRSFLENPKLRGRKFYWHRKSVAVDDTTKYPKQRAQIRPVRAGKRFRFEIGFDRLTPSELETLLWVLTFGEQNDAHAHKLGHAKPIGYGSVRVVKADVSVVTLGEDLTFRKHNTTEYAAKKPSESRALAEYLKITDFSEPSDDVNYPKGNNGRDRNPIGVYQWFGINKGIRLNDFNPSFNYVLPKPLDDDVSLPEYEPSEGPIGGNRKDFVYVATPESDSDIQVSSSQRTQSQRTQSQRTQSRPAQSRQTQSQNSYKQTQLRVRDVVSGEVIKINTSDDGTPLSADVAIKGCDLLGLLNKKNLEKSRLAVGAKSSFSVTVVRDDGKVNLKLCDSVSD